MVKDPTTVSQTDKQALGAGDRRQGQQGQGRRQRHGVGAVGYEWKYFASSEGSYIEQEIYTTTPS